MGRAGKTCKKDRSIGPAVLFVLIFGVIAILAISIPLYRQHQFAAFTSDLSGMTTQAGSKEMVTCSADSEEFTISSDAAYGVYSKLVGVKMAKPVSPREDAASEGLTLTYGLLGGQLVLAPAEYRGEEALYVDYQSSTLHYTYIAPHLDYRNLHETVSRGRLP